MAAPEKDGKVWRHRFMLKGVRLSGTFPTKAHALAWEAEKRASILAPVGTGKTCGDAFIKYAREVSPKKDGEKWEHRRLVAFGKSSLAKVLASEVSATDLSKWRDDRLLTVKGATVIRDFNLLSHVFSIARKEWKWLDHSPTKDAARPKDSTPRDRRITDKEIEMMCVALGFDDEAATKAQRTAVAFLFAIETAMRQGEIAQLRKSHIVGSVAHLPAEICKTRKKRDVPLSKRARELLTMLPEADPLFGLTAPQIEGMFRSARKRSPIEDLHFHDSRHEAITRLAKRMTVLQLARMVGHSDINQLLSYFNESAADMVKLLD